MARTSPASPDMRAHLVEAAYRVLAERGYEAMSIKDVASAAGVAPGLIHYYFASKAELLLAVVREAAARAARKRAALGQTAAGCVWRPVLGARGRAASRADRP